MGMPGNLVFVSDHHDRSTETIEPIEHPQHLSCAGAVEVSSRLISQQQGRAGD
jgi:hypothetical protein